MTVYIVGLVVFLAVAAIFLEFTFWFEREVRETQLWDDVQPRNRAKTQADAWNDAYLSLVAPRPYDWKQK